MLKQRIITALVIAIVFAGFLFATTPLVFSLFAAAVVATGSWEWSRLAAIEPFFERVLYTLAVLLLIFGAAHYAGLTAHNLIIENIRPLLLIACVWWAVALLWVQGYPSSAVLWGSSAVRLVMGIVVLVPAWIAMVLLIHQPQGAALIILVVLIVACADIGAYFTGRALGHHKLARAVSPGKTVEGVLGGLSTVIIVSLIFLYFSPSQWSLWWQWTLVVAMTALVSVLGDLLESMVKRHRGVKDSGTILPGHGGILDRIDSLTAALPVFSLLYILLIAH